jgi:DNA-binding response OmpR family regulator
VQKKILFVVGDRDTRDLLAHTFSDHGFGTSSASDGVSGMFQFGLVQPDLVVLDSNDWETLKRIRALSGVPIIALIEDETKSKVESLNQGADYFVIKPPSLHELDAKVRALFRSPPTLPVSAVPPEHRVEAGA